MTKIKSDTQNWVMSFKLRNGFADEVIISGLDHERIEDNLRSRGRDTDHLHSFVLFSSGEWAYAISFRHLVFCQFLPTSHLEPAEGDDDPTARIYLANEKEPIELQLDPALVSESDGPRTGDINQIELLFRILEIWNSKDDVDKRAALTDEDDDTSYFRIDDIAMLVVTRRCYDPDYSP